MLRISERVLILFLMFLQFTESTSNAYAKFKVTELELHQTQIIYLGQSLIYILFLSVILTHFKTILLIK